MKKDELDSVIHYLLKTTVVRKRGLDGEEIRAILLNARDYLYPLERINEEDVYQFLVDYTKAHEYDIEVEKIINQETDLTATEAMARKGVARANCRALAEKFCSHFWGAS